MKKLILAVTVLMLTLALTGCFNSNQKPESTPNVEPPKEQSIPNKEEVMKIGKNLWENLHRIEKEINNEREYKDEVIKYIYKPGQYIANSDVSPLYKDSKFSYADENVYLDATGSFWYDATVTLDVFNIEINEAEVLKKNIKINFLLDVSTNTYKIKYADIQFIEKLK